MRLHDADGSEVRDRRQCVECGPATCILMNGSEVELPGSTRCVKKKMMLPSAARDGEFTDMLDQVVFPGLPWVGSYGVERR